MKIKNKLKIFCPTQFLPFSEVDSRMAKLMEQFYTEMEMTRQRVHHDIDTQVRHKIDRLDEMEFKAKDVLRKYKQYK